MRTTIRIGEKTVGDGQGCFIIAEAGVNHDGDLEKAKLLVDLAKDAGADAVKFQTWITENLCLKGTAKAGYQEEQTGAGSQFDMIKRLELGFDDFAALKRHCEKRGILFLSTPDDMESAAFLNRLGVPALKVGSGELDNPLYLRYLARFGKPLILSTGTGTMEEVRVAVSAIRGTGNEELIVLHCTTDYPTRLEDVNLRAMQAMRDALGVLVGYSDHTTSVEVPVIARALGAVVIEKHYTYDKGAAGPDHKASLGPDELKEMVRGIRALDLLPPEGRLAQARRLACFETVLGSAEKRPTRRERANTTAVRKSIVARSPIAAGTTVIEELLIMKRTGGRGIPASDYERVIGKKARRSLPAETPITMEDLEEPAERTREEKREERVRGDA